MAIILSDGILLEDNPWICSCELTWLSDWLRRWAKDLRRSHILEPMLVSWMTDAFCVSFDGKTPHSNSKDVPLIELRAHLRACDAPSLASSIHYATLTCVPVLIAASTALSCL